MWAPLFSIIISTTAKRRLTWCAIEPNQLSALSYPIRPGRRQLQQRRFGNRGIELTCSLAALFPLLQRLAALLRSAVALAVVVGCDDHGHMGPHRHAPLPPVRLRPVGEEGAEEMGPPYRRRPSLARPDPASLRTAKENFVDGIVGCDDHGWHMTGLPRFVPAAPTGFVWMCCWVHATFPLPLPSPEVPVVLDILWVLWIFSPNPLTPRRHTAEHCLHTRSPLAVTGQSGPGVYSWHGRHAHPI